MAPISTIRSDDRRGCISRANESRLYHFELARDITPGTHPFVARAFATAAWKFVIDEATSRVAHYGAHRLRSPHCREGGRRGGQFDETITSQRVEDCEARRLVRENEAGAIAVGTDLDGMRWEPRSSHWEDKVVLSPGQRATHYVAIAMGEKTESREVCDRFLMNPATWIEDSRRASQDETKDLFAKLPRLAASNRSSVEYYNRSLQCLILNRGLCVISRTDSERDIFVERSRASRFTIRDVGQHPVKFEIVTIPRQGKSDFAAPVPIVWKKDPGTRPCSPSDECDEPR